MDPHKKAKHTETGATWDVTAGIYERDEQKDIDLLRSGGSSLHAIEQRQLGDLSGWCARAIHLQCAGGTDTLSLWKMGAAEVVGVDISEKMIAVARRKSSALGAPARWYAATFWIRPMNWMAAPTWCIPGAERCPG